jgi:hypothetical protein
MATLVVIKGAHIFSLEHHNFCHFRPKPFETFPHRMLKILEIYFSVFPTILNLREYRLEKQYSSVNAYII